jgi:hypothetical protein
MDADLQAMKEDNGMRSSTPRKAATLAVFEEDPDAIEALIIAVGLGETGSSVAAQALRGNRDAATPSTRPAPSSKPSSSTRAEEPGVSARDPADANTLVSGGGFWHRQSPARGHGIARLFGTGDTEVVMKLPSAASNPVAPTSFRSSGTVASTARDRVRRCHRPARSKKRLPQPTR